MPLTTSFCRLPRAASSASASSVSLAHRRTDSRRSDRQWLESSRKPASLTCGSSGRDGQEDVVMALCHGYTQQVMMMAW